MVFHQLQLRQMGMIRRTAIASEHVKATIRRATGLTTRLHCSSLPAQHLQQCNDCRRALHSVRHLNYGIHQRSSSPFCEKGRGYWFSTKIEASTELGDKSPEEDSNKTSSAEARVAAIDNVLLDESNLITQSSKGLGQVIFVNSPIAGLAILGGLALGDPYLGSLAALGSLTSTVTAKQSQLDKGALYNGLWGYNGALVGCAVSVFVAPNSFFMGAATTIGGATASTFVASALGSALDGRMPQWTYAFNITTLTMLLYCQPLMPHLPESVSEGAAETPSNAVASASSLMDLSMGDFLASPLKGVSQIFVVENPWTGLVILGATSFWYSPKLAQSLLMGSTVGTITGLAMGAPIEELTMGLWGFNSALTSAAVAVFYVPNKYSNVLSVGGAAATAVLFGGLKSAFALVGTPALTLPFCLCMSGCYLLRDDVVPGLNLATNPHSPEKNEKGEC